MLSESYGTGPWNWTSTSGVAVPLALHDMKTFQPKNDFNDSGVLMGMLLVESESRNSIPSDPFAYRKLEDFATAMAIKKTSGPVRTSYLDFCTKNKLRSL